MQKKRRKYALKPNQLYLIKPKRTPEYEGEICIEFNAHGLYVMTEGKAGLVLTTFSLTGGHIGFRELK